MAKTKSQLEIYKIILGNKTIHQIIEEKASAEGVVLDNDNDFSNYLFRNLIYKLTQDIAWKSDNPKLGLSLFADNREDFNSILTNHSEHNCIEGFIDGGPYDNIKTVAQTTDVSLRELLGRDKMVTERFYLYLYLPLGAKIGLLFIEKKGSLKISSAVRHLIIELLKTYRSSVSLERFVPRSIIEEYKNNSIVDTLTFADYMTTSVIDANEGNPVEKCYRVSIRITPPSEDKTDYNLVNNMLDSLKEASIKLGLVTKQLFDFSTKRGTLKTNHKSYSFTLGNDLKIKPIIEIDDALQDDELGTLRRSEIKKICDDLLVQIRDEIYVI